MNDYNKCCFPKTRFVRFPVGRLVGRSVGWLVGRSVGWSVCHNILKGEDETFMFLWENLPEKCFYFSGTSQIGGC